MDWKFAMTIISRLNLCWRSESYFVLNRRLEHPNGFARAKRSNFILIRSKRKQP